MIFVTGAEGYIGSHLIAKLQEQEIPYKAFSKPLDNYCSCSLAGSDTIVHLAQLKDRLESIRQPAKYMSRNVLDTYRLLLYANKQNVMRFVYISSAAIYEDQSPYGLTKRLSELLVREVFDGLKIILRVFNVYGGVGSNSVVDKFQNESELIVHGDGTQVRDFIHVDTVVDWIIEACTYNFSHDFDVGSGKPVQILELAKSYRKPYTFAPDVDPGVSCSVATL